MSCCVSGMPFEGKLLGGFKRYSFEGLLCVFRVLPQVCVSPCSLEEVLQEEEQIGSALPFYLLSQCIRLAIFLLVAIFTQSFFAFVRSNLVSFAFFSARHSSLF